MKKLILSLSLLALFFAAPSHLHAQDSSSMIGTVTDATGAVVPGTTVTLVNTLTGAKYTQITDNKGAYRFLNVPPNQGYTATFNHAGFATREVDKFPLLVGSSRTLDVKLVAGNTEAVVVSSANEITLDTTDASIGNNIDVELLNELPVQDRTNGVATLFDLQAGVDFNSGSVTGARIDQTEVTLDGLDVNDIAAGTTFAIVATAPIDSIQQFGGTVAGLVPAVGTGSGGQFQLVTKSGTNKFHGNINEYHRDTTTVANSFFNNLDGVPRTPLIRNQFGGNIGGPIKKDKLFFFFEINDSRIIQSATGEQTVPLPNLTASAPTLNYINNSGNCTGGSRLNTTPTCISSLTAAQVQQLDPAHIGFDQSLIRTSSTQSPGFIDTRYPAPNDPAAGDGVNTGGYRYTVPIPDIETTYIGKIDYNLTPKQHIFGRFTINRENATESLPVFPTDPVTHPYIDRSYAYVVSHVWTIGNNKVNQFYYGDNISKYSFPNAYNPTGADQFSFSGLSGPYSGNDGQKRRVPIPEFRDDFNWQLGSHNLTMGGLFKFIKTNSNLINNFNFVGVGLQGSALSGGLTDPANPSVRPPDINQNNGALTDYDSLFATSLGVIGDISTNFNYTNKGTPIAAGLGGPRAYRYYETEAYVGDTWKITPKFTMTYGLRYQLYTVPYEAHGSESVEFTNTTTQQQTTLDAYIKARQAVDASGNSSATSLPIYSVKLGGKANNGPPLYQPSYKDFAPRVGFAYHAAPRTIINGSAGIVYDRTVINAINFLQDQISYLFSNNQVNQFGDSTSPYNSLLIDSRVGPNLSYNSALNPVGAALPVPYTPYVDDANGDATGIPNQPYGLAVGATNFVISPNLKDPYSIAFNLGIQQQFSDHLLLKVSYAGRLGRRLLADADAGQVLDVPDYTGGSTQTLSQAFAGLTQQTRACQAAGISLGNCPLTAQPWFEDVLAPYGAAVGFGNNTNLVNYIIGQYGPNGDISDAIFRLGGVSEVRYSGIPGFLPTNIGIPSQFGSNAYLNNQGNSSYNGLLVTLEKSTSFGLKFDFNYTFSHSIDNTSLSANGNALFSNSGFICDITKPRACRGSSDFDVNQIITSDFVYALPFGRGRTFMNHAPIALEELAGGWSVSGLPSFRSGLAVTPYSGAYLASFDNQDPAIFIGGNKADLHSSVNVDHASQTVYGFAGGLAGANKVLAEFRGPIGLEYGNRNLIRGPHYSNFDVGLAKRFPIIPKEDLNLIFRADAFNILNHPSFGTPGVNILGNQSAFGQIGGTSDAPRVAQFSLRLEF